MLLPRPITIELSKIVASPESLRLPVSPLDRLTKLLDGAGGDNRARTGDLLRARQALSQLSYIPGKSPASLVGLRGVEPLTSRLSGVRSNHN
jgi:hypothetical protein